MSAYQPAGDDITLLTAGTEINPHICTSMFLFRLGLTWSTCAVGCSEKDGESLTCYHYYGVNDGRVVELKGYFVYFSQSRSADSDIKPKYRKVNKAKVDTHLYNIKDPQLTHRQPP